MKRLAILLGSAFPLIAAVALPAAPTDPVAQLQARISSGELKLAFDARQGYLPALLKELDIDPRSQVLVFSKSSLQSSYISPKTPRALYYNAESYVGWIPGAPMIEIMSVDPKRGPQFYTIANTRPNRPAFRTETRDCTRCHGAIGPTLFARSSPTAPSGYPRVFTRSYAVTPRLPLRHRWGGWYVTGLHGGQRHMGNELSVGTDEKNRIDIEKGANVVDLRRYFDVRGYPTPHSDIVALLAMEAQMDVQNEISRLAQGMEEDPEALVRSLLGCGEALLTSPIKGTSGFMIPAPKDARGRSLGDLDLRTRLLKYPCHPLIYSPSFDALPPSLKRAVAKRLRAVLTGEEKDPAFSHLSADDRQAILEILRATKPDLSL